MDDGSTDRVKDVLNPFIEKELITMMPSSPKTIPFRQTGIYKKSYAEIVSSNDTKWLAIIDLDEFIYAPKVVDIRTVLREHEDLALVGLNWVWFGSSSLVEQPQGVVQSFLRRADMDTSKYPEFIEHYKIMAPSRHHYNDWQKYIINTDHDVDNIDIHSVVIEGIADNLSYNRYPEDPPLLLNHYSVQSRDFFLKNKAARGDVNNWAMEDSKNLQRFRVYDINDVLDSRLAEQNSIYVTLSEASSVV